MKCVTCKAACVESEEVVMYKLGGGLYESKRPVLFCTECGASYTDGLVQRGFERDAALYFLANAPKRFSPDVFWFARKAVGPPIDELAYFWGVSPATIFSWRDGKEPIPRWAWVLVRDMLEDDVADNQRTLDYLRAMGPYQLPSGAEVE